MKKIILLLLLAIFLAGCGPVDELENAPSTTKGKIALCTSTCIDNNPVKSPYVEDQCAQACEESYYYGGEEALDRILDEQKGGATAIKAKDEGSVDPCMVLPKGAKASCIESYIKKDETFTDYSVCSHLVEDIEKNDCLNTLSLRAALAKDDPSLCTSAYQISGCYASYVVRKDICSGLERVGRTLCILDELGFNSADIRSELMNDLSEAFGAHGVSFSDDASLMQAIYAVDFELCDSLCEKDPAGWTRNSEDCDRAKCLSEIVLYNDQFGWEDCQRHYMRDPTYGENDGRRTCVGAEAKRNNDPTLCDILAEVHESHASGCRHNVETWN